MIPISMIFFGFDTKQAIGLSNASICVASICRYFFNFNKSHPLKNGNGVLVDYNIASIMLPMIVVGATIGVMFNKMLPSSAIIAILTVLLLLVALTTLRKLIKICADEKKKYGPLCGGKEGKPNPKKLESKETMDTVMKEESPRNTVELPELKQSDFVA